MRNYGTDNLYQQNKAIATGEKILPQTKNRIGSRQRGAIKISEVLASPSENDISLVSKLRMTEYCQGLRNAWRVYYISSGFSCPGLLNPKLSQYLLTERNNIKTTEYRSGENYFKGVIQMLHFHIEHTRRVSLSL